MIRDVPGWAAYFYTYTFLKNNLNKWFNINKDNDNRNKFKEFLIKNFAGGMAGVNSWLVSYPFDVIKTDV
jgi:uncharacterized protein YfdQ (DUF2303 family)